MLRTTRASTAISPYRLTRRRLSCCTKFSRRHLTRSCTRATIFRRLLRSGVPCASLANLLWARAKGLFLLPEKAWIVYLAAIGEIGKGCEADVVPHGFRRRGQDSRSHLIAGKAHEPLACRRAGDGTGFHNPFEGAVLDHLEMPNLGEGQLPLLIDAKACLGVGEAVVALARLESGVAWNLPQLAASEEGFERFVYAMQHILQHLRVDRFILRA